MAVVLLRDYIGEGKGPGTKSGHGEIDTDTTDGEDNSPYGPLSRNPQEIIVPPPSMPPPAIIDNDTYGNREPVEEGPTKVDKALALLVVEVGANRGQQFRLLGEDLRKIGRDRHTCNFALDDDRASREHAVVKYEDGAFYLIDIGSSNGTLVNGDPIVRQELHDGDTVKIGNTTMVFKSIYNSK